MDKNMIAALLRERDAYASQGKDDRVRQVNEQLAYHGHVDPETQEEGPRERSAPPQVTADADAPQVTAAAPEVEQPQPQRGRGRPRLPRDSAGNIIKE